MPWPKRTALTGAGCGIFCNFQIMKHLVLRLKSLWRKIASLLGDIQRKKVDF
jgi:hypothetical protein